MLLTGNQIKNTYKSLLSLPDATGFAGATFTQPEDYGGISDGGGILSPISVAQIGAKISPNTVAGQVFLEANPTTAIFTVQGWQSGSGQVNLHEFLNNGDQVANINTTLVYSATVSRTITFPDATGTVALTSQIPSLTGYLQNNVGIAGGTTLIGGTAASENLTLVSTSNATKGNIFFGVSGTMVFDGVNLRFGMGVAAPAVRLDVRSAGTTGDIAYLVNSTLAKGILISATSGNSMITTPAGGEPLVIANGSTPAQLYLASSTTANVGIRNNNPTARLHIMGGATGAGTAPWKVDSGSLNTTAEVGAFEFLTDKIYFTITTGAARKEITLNDAALTANTFPVAGTNGRLIDSTFTTTNLTSTTYTPVVTNVTNITSSTGHVSQWHRIGSVVTVFGYIDVTTTGAGASEVGVALPVASNFAAATDANGLGSCDTANCTSLFIEADSVNERAALKFISGAGATARIYFSFSYSVI